MGAYRTRILFRYAPGDTVYLKDSPEPWTVEGYTWHLIHRPRSEQKIYRLQDTQGTVFETEERHVLRAPLPQGPQP
jgi:hypothetical protein